jgi:hypothetical protein
MSTALRATYNMSSYLEFISSHSYSAWLRKLPTITTLEQGCSFLRDKRGWNVK